MKDNKSTSKGTKKKKAMKTDTISDFIPLKVSAAVAQSAFSSVTVSNDDVPSDWEDRAALAQEYYQLVGLVKTAVNTWRTFALGDKILFLTEDEANQGAVDAMMERLKLNNWSHDMILQLLVKGDCIGYIEPNQKGDNIERVICVNPLSVALEYEDSELIKAVQTPVDENGIPLDEITLDLDSCIHLKWDVPEFEPRGNSMILAAFNDIQALIDYRLADRAIAKQWTTPLRFIHVGGEFGGKIYYPDQSSLEDIRNLVNTMNVRSALVVPWHVKVETYGIQGAIPDTEKKISDLKDSILVDLGLSRSVVTGEGANYATARVALDKFIVELKAIRKQATALFDWVFADWQARQGTDFKIEYRYPSLDLADREATEKMLLELYDRGLISKTSLQTAFNMSPEVEAAASKEEVINIDTTLSGAELAQLVALDVITVDEARKFMGITDSKNSADETAGVSDGERMYLTEMPNILKRDPTTSESE